MAKRVAIVGAGVSGLLACKYTLSKGYSPVVFEAESRIGGVWSGTLETTRLQSPGLFYQFSDFPWPDSVTDLYPSQQEVMDYLHSYALHFDLLSRIKFNHKVVRLSYEGPSDAEIQAWSLWGGTGEAFSNKGKWNVTIQDNQTLSIEEHQFDFIILCVGRYGDAPYMPSFPQGEGPEVFKGDVMHSSDFSRMGIERAREMLKGKRSTVVGFGKTALDMAMVCSEVNGVESPCTMIYRNEHWTFVDDFVWGMPIIPLFFTRISELCVHKPDEGFLSSLLATILSPMWWAISKFIETDLNKKLNLAKHGTVPEQLLMKELFAGVACSLPNGFYQRVDDGRLKLVKTKKFKFCRQGILVEGKGKEEMMETDVVIFSTGFRGVNKVKDVLEPSFQKCVKGPPGTNKIVLYRECILPRVPQLAVIGMTESYTNVITWELMSRWLVEVLDGTIKLPSIHEMEKDIEKWESLKQRYAGEYYDRSNLGMLRICFSDKLCEDMGWNPRRKKGFFPELFEPYLPSDYAHP